MQKSFLPIWKLINYLTKVSTKYIVNKKISFWKCLHYDSYCNPEALHFCLGFCDFTLFLNEVIASFYSFICKKILVRDTLKDKVTVMATIETKKSFKLKSCTVFHLSSLYFISLKCNFHLFRSIKNPDRKISLMSWIFVDPWTVHSNSS